MTNDTATRLRRSSDKIMKIWSDRARQEVAAAQHQKGLALSDSLPEYLEHLADALSTAVDRKAARALWDQAARIGKKHGSVRAGSKNYTIDQLITEYHILRQVIWDVLEEEAPLTPIELETIVGSMEQAVNFAATQFSDTLIDIQERLTQALAHDLINPISAAKSNALLILRRPDNVDHCVKAASRISMDMDRIDSMIHDLLDASRIRAGEPLPLQFDECDLDLITRQVAEGLNFNYPNRFVVQSTGECTGYWSESGLRRVLENLATNAVKYGAPDSPVTLSVRQTQDDALVSVHNEGRPIPAQEREALFEQFRRARATESKPGWGLGLSVVKGLTEAHHGKVLIESEAGRGTTFTVVLPKDRRIDVGTI